MVFSRPFYCILLYCILQYNLFYCIFLLYFIVFLAFQYSEIQKRTKRRQWNQDDPGKKGTSRNEKVRGPTVFLGSCSGMPAFPSAFLSVDFPFQESAGRGAERESPLLRQAAVHRWTGAQVQKLLPGGGPGTLQRVSTSTSAGCSTCGVQTAGGLSHQEEGNV